MLAWVGSKDCFVKSFKASKRGCRSPIKEGLLGPKRIMNKPIILRSNKVKKATDSITKRHWRNQDKKSMNEGYSGESFISFED